MKLELLENIDFTDVYLPKGTILDVEVIAEKENGSRLALINQDAGASGDVYRESKILYQSPDFDSYRTRGGSIDNACWLEIGPNYSHARMLAYNTNEEASWVLRKD